MKDTPLVEESLTTLFLEYMVYPTLYSPFEKLSNYFRDNHHLFTLLGVFGAVTIYARNAVENLGVPEAMQQLAIGPGFAIVILISLVTLSDAIRRMRTAKKIHSVENLGLILFTLFFLPLVAAVAGVAAQPNIVWASYLFFLIYSGPLAFVLLLITGIGMISSLISKKSKRMAQVFTVTMLSSIVLSVSYYVGTNGIEPPQPSDPTTLTFAEWADFAIVYLSTWSLIIPLLALGLMFATYLFRKGKSISQATSRWVGYDEPPNDEAGVESESEVEEKIG